MTPWGRVVQHAIAIFLALLLATVLGSISLFKESALGGSGLTASDFVQFLGYGGALLLLWLLAYRGATQLPEDGKGLSFLRRILIPLATLIVVSVGYRVLRLLVESFLEGTIGTIYNWAFVLGIVGAAVWLALVGFQHSALLVEASAALVGTRQLTSREAWRPCPQCGTAVTAGMKFCGHCGQGLAALVCRNCSTPLTPADKFCRACGTALG